MDAQNRQAVIALCVFIAILGIAAYLLFWRDGALGVGIQSIDDLLLRTPGLISP